MAQFPYVTNLENLDVTSTIVGVMSMSLLKRYPNLTEWNLNNNDINDASAMATAEPN